MLGVRLGQRTPGRGEQAGGKEKAYVLNAISVDWELALASESEILDSFLGSYLLMSSPCLFPFTLMNRLKG